MSKRHDLGLRTLNLLSNSLVSDVNLLWKTELGMQIRTTAEAIIKVIGKCEATNDIDSMMRLEKRFQQIDYRDARTALGKSSAQKAANDYKQIDAAIAQMRSDPQGYVLANESLQTDGLKLPAARGPNQIRANIARLQNRNNFPSPEYEAIWKARIKLAKATQRQLAELHAATIERYHGLEAGHV